MNVATKDINKLVRAVAKNEGWDIWSTYSDKRKDGTRRLKYMRNGWEPSNSITSAIESTIKARIRKYDNVVEMGWAEGMDPMRGSYPYFYVVVNDADSDFDASIGKVVATEEGKLIDGIFKKPLYVYANEWNGEVRYVLSTKVPTITIGKNKGTTKLTPRKAEAVKTAIGPSRLKSLMNQGHTDLPEKVYNKLVSL